MQKSSSFKTFMCHSVSHDVQEAILLKLEGANWNLNGYNFAAKGAHILNETAHRIYFSDIYFVVCKSVYCYVIECQENGY